MAIDYLIIGGGPTGLTLAWILAQYKRQVLLIERSSSLGGCHRVNRVDGYFSEHGPRVYESSYVNFIEIIKDLGLDFYQLFTPYKINTSQTSNELLSHFSLRELLILALQFAKLVLNNRAGSKITVSEFMTKHGFSSNAQDYADRLCRLTDGAGADRYTILEFVQLLNQRFFYQIYQPKQANDQSLFKHWAQRLLATGYVKIILNTQVERLIKDQNRIVAVQLNNNQTISANYILAAIPPVHLAELLDRSQINAYNKDFKTWVEQTKYITYLPVSFHWHQKLELPVKWGFSATSDWGLVWITLSDYFDPAEPLSKTLISTCITKPDTISTFTGKTANQSDRSEVVTEIYRQLKSSFPNLSMPDKILLSPELTKSTQNNWQSTEQAFVLTPAGFLPSRSPLIENLYSVGTHNGFSPIDFTSIESAVANAQAMAHQLIPQSKRDFPIKYPVTLTDVIRMILIVWILIKLKKLF